MTLEQLKTYTVGVLKGWFSNKQVLDKLSESEDGNLLYNGNEITGSGSESSNEPAEPVQPIVVGRKMYPILDLTGHQNGYAIGTHNYDMGNPIWLTQALTDSLENYDAIVMYCKQIDDAGVPTLITSGEIDVSLIKQFYNGCSILIYFPDATLTSIWCGFTDANNACIFCNTIDNLTILNIYGIKYETVSADPITDAQVSEAVAETVEGLNAEETE